MQIRFLVAKGSFALSLARGMAYDLEYWQRWLKNSGGCAKSGKGSSKNESSGRRVPRGTQGVVAGRAGGLGKKRARGHVFGSAVQRPNAAKPVSCDAVGALYSADDAKRYSGGSIGLARRSSTLQQSGGCFQVPGPGEYRAACAFGRQIESSKRSALSAFTLSSKRGDVFEKRSDGPVAYDDGSGDLACRPQVRSHAFSQAPRLNAAKQTPEFHVPGPGAYAVPERRSTSGAKIGPDHSTTSYITMMERAERASSYRSKPRLESCGYGHQCNREEHIKFGQCISGKCSSRATWEVKKTVGPGVRPLAHLTVCAISDEEKGFPRGRDPGEMLDVLAQLDLNECDDQGRNVLAAISALEFEPQESQLRKLHVVFKAAGASRQELDVDAQDVNGDTPLHLAVRSEQAQIVEFLLLKHADPEIENHNGDTALDLASRLFGKQQIFQAVRARTMMHDIQAELEQVERSTRQASRQCSSPLKTRGSSSSSTSCRGGIGKVPFGGLPSRESTALPQTREGGFPTSTGVRMPTPLFGGLPSRQTTRMSLSRQTANSESSFGTL